MQMLENGDRVPVRFVSLCANRWVLMTGGCNRSIAHQIPRLPVERRRLPPPGSYGQGSSNLKRTYYVVPAGMSVIFRDENGNELKRQATQFTSV